jgi:hypothetical protein
MYKTLLFIVFSSFSLFTISVATFADTGAVNAAVDKAIEGGFSELEKQVIEKYFKRANSESVETEEKNKKDKGKGLPPGLAKKEKLPPGLAMQLEKNGTLPPGLAKRDLPEDLNAELPDPVEGLERAIVDNAVVLVEKATGKIVDILKDVVSGNW